MAKKTILAVGCLRYNARMVRGDDIYEIRLFDRSLVEFSFGDFEPVKVVDWDEMARELLPLGLEPDAEGLWRWLSTRAIPQNRRFAGEICRSLGLSPTDRSGILEVSRGLSLNDSYWIVPRGFDGRFDEFNLFENGFSAVLAAVAYTGVASNLEELTPSSPELTTNGTLRKAWKIDERGVRQLYKGSSVSEAHVGEARVEFLVSQVERAMGIDSAVYRLDSWSRDEGGPCSVCDCFCTKELSYVPQALAFGQSSHTEAAKSYLAWNEEQFERYASMMLLDALVCNTDRHLTNFGVLRDARTGKVLRTAPVFDNGRALFFNLAFDQTDQFQLEAEMSLPAWAQATFLEQAARLLGPVQRGQLERLSSFEFSNCEKFPFPEEYLAALSAFVRHRAEALAGSPDVDRDELRSRIG